MTTRTSNATAPLFPAWCRDVSGCSNAEIGSMLEEVAELLALSDTTPFRARAYRHAAQRVRAMRRSIAQIARDGGTDALTRVAGIGPNLARVIVEIVSSGRLAMLDWLRGHADPEALLASVPGIGPELARRIHERLGVHTLEDLEAAAHDGRLGGVTGMGPRRIQAVRDVLAHRLGRHSCAMHAQGSQPSVGEILDVDREYREKAAAGVLRTIAPRRFNPRHRAWLPVLHTRRGDRDYTALFSNTARAHDLGKTNDWVVIFLDDDGSHHQATVVTESRGALATDRVVRGRERECLAYYRNRWAAEAKQHARRSSDEADQTASRATGTHD